MKYISLFSGIGGFDLALDRVGMTCVAQVERDPKCLNLLANKWPTVHRSTDVKEFPDGRFECDLICGGFPCQDLSVAGKRAGLAGERSGLWYEYARVIEKLTPRWVLIENVPGLLSSNGGRDFGVLLGQMAAMGYGFAYRVLDAQWFGVAQRRRRVFIVGHSGADWRRAARVLFEPESVPSDSPPSREAGSHAARALACSSVSSGYRLDPNGEELIPFDERNVTSKHNRSKCEPGGPCHTLHAAAPSVAYGIRSDAIREGEAKTPSPDAEGRVRLRNPGLGVSEEVAPTSDTVAPHIVAYQRHGSNVGPFGALRAGNGDVTGGVPFTCHGWTGDPTPKFGDELQPTLRAEQGGERFGVAGSMGVRRLTPTECERLQGFPDGWTAGFPKSTRYRMLGNAVAVPVVEWIAKRIMKESR